MKASITFNKKKHFMMLIVVISGFLLSCSRQDIIISDFEGSDYGNWMNEGEAFGKGPATRIPGAIGEKLVNTSIFPASEGSLTSPPFKAERKYLVFLLGGGNYSEKLCVNLLQEGKVVQTITGNDNVNNFRALEWRFFDLAGLNGKEVQIQILDQVKDSWYQLMTDHFYLSDKVPVIEKSMDFNINRKYINLPVRTGDPLKRVQLLIDDKLFQEFNIELADSSPEFYVFFDVSSFQGKKAKLIAPAFDRKSKAFDFISMDDEIKEAGNLYREPYRQQIHFSSRRGWNNDPNGLVYHDGEYHLFYQLNPYGWNHGNMHWGHAISNDLVHWTELPIGIYPLRYGMGVWSGSAIMDYDNTSGFKTGDEDVMIAAYTSGGRGEVIEFSNDNGRSFTYYQNNPVVKHEGRDPKLIWYDAGKHWVMAVYHEEEGKKWIAFHTSDNLKDWTYQSKIEGFYECPEIFQLPVDGNSSKSKWILYAADGAYVIGSFNGKEFKTELGKFPNNFGNCFYASQTFNNIPPEDGRLIQLAWGWVSTPGMPFNQCMLFPTQLSLRTTKEGIRMFTEPVKEIELLHSKEWKKENLVIEPNTNPVSGIEGELFHIKGDFKVSKNAQIGFKIHGLEVLFDAAKGELTCLDKKAECQPEGGKIYFEIIVDRNTVEIFCNHGRIYIPIARDLTKGYGLELICRNEKVIAENLQIFELKSIWQ